MDAENSVGRRFQDRGALLCLDTSHERFAFATRNANAVLGRPADTALKGQLVAEVFERDLLHAIRNCIGSQSLHKRRRYLGVFSSQGQPYDVELFAVKEQFVLEIVPTGNEHVPGVYEALQDYEVLSDALISKSSSDGLFDRLTSLLRVMSGYHCVAIDCVDVQGVRLVSAAGNEDFATCPTDFPRQLSAVRDVAGATTCFDRTDASGDFDYGLSGLSVPEPEVLSALRDQNICACAALGLWRGSERWGRIKFLHGQPRLPNRRTKLAMEFLGPLLGQRLLSLH